MRRFLAIATVLFGSLVASSAHALPSVSINLSDAGGTEISSAFKIVIFITLLSVAPAILVTMTCFTRIIVVFSFVRQAIGIHTSPPNQVLIGLSLFITIFVMTPVITQINETAIAPYRADKINIEQAFKSGMDPLRKFMYAQTRDSDIALMLKLSKQERPKNFDELSNTVLIPSYIISELKTAFEIGFLIYIPFVIIDMLVSMVLLTMGMMMLPPVMISLPFKLLIFVLVDGWELLIGSLVRSFS